MASKQVYLDLSDKVALVTGGSRGIGLAIAEKLLQAGSKIVVVYRSADVPAELKSIEKLSSDVLKISGVDVRDQTKVRDSIRMALERFGDIHILVNNAGVYPHSSPLETEEAEWDWVIDTNLKGAFLFSREVAKVMIKKRHPGKIINIASINAFVPEPDLAHYDASKAGLLGLTRSLALSWGKYGICVNAVAPGLVDTEGLEKVAPRRVASFKRFSPLGTLVKPESVANAVLFLASNLSNDITGQVIIVDAGIMLSGYMAI